MIFLYTTPYAQLPWDPGRWSRFSDCFLRHNKLVLIVRLVEWSPLRFGWRDFLDPLDNSRSPCSRWAFIDDGRRVEVLMFFLAIRTDWTKAFQEVWANLGCVVDFHVPERKTSHEKRNVISNKAYLGFCKYGVCGNRIDISLLRISMSTYIQSRSR